MWTGDTMTNAYELIVNILTAIGVYDQIYNLFEIFGMAYVLKILIVSVLIAVLFAFVLVTVMFLTWMERKVVALVQVRYGPMVTGPRGLLQPVMDGIKLIGKEDIIPAKADRWIFTLAPFIVFVPALLIFIPIPFGNSLIISDLRVGLLYIIAISAVSPIAVLLAGWASNNKYSLLGAMRAVAQDISYTIPLALAAIAVVIFTGSLSTVDIVNAQGDYWFGIIPKWFIFLQPIGFVLFLIASIAELGRIPFDFQESESELVAGFFTEYSGMKFAMFFLAEYAHLFAVSGIVVTLFLGGWNGPVIPFIPVQITSLVYFLIKTYAVIFFTMWLRDTVPRMRIDQLLNIGWKIMVPLALLNLLVAGFLVTAGVI
ncbi:NADH:ubiquinone oxidoreductase subunit 1 (chain H) [Candidatus Methanoperedens nitroreducens]|uniref:F(420)H(2) dehydrogenase subunit H n=2 Tax=Candidatus Methanoperedens nitratireducens TaxID=1392998 RepID=A0A062V074_9EURY|nr:NADH:ubiquinone oxidoreductase subunit 1 (chain H) [Candidatus Methanoperedens nitroreducens]